MEWHNALQEIQAQWQVPGFSLIISEPEQSAVFWYYVRLQYGCSMLSFPVNQFEFASWTAELSQSFLGAMRVYWCPIPPATPKQSKIRQQAIQFLKQYTGPHTVWSIIAPEQGSEYAGCRRFIVPAAIRGVEIAVCAEFLGMQRSNAVLEAFHVIPARSTVTLDVVVQLLMHAGYAPVRRYEGAIDFLRTLLPDEVSLQQLAELFFKNDWPVFFEKWSSTAPQYSDMFWITFWAEQCWRAYWVCWYMQRGQQTRARSMGYRLPPSFVQSGWQKSSLSELKNRYDIIALFDTRVKQGSFFSMHEVMMRLV
jgi:hypothetical protein